MKTPRGDRKKTGTYLSNQINWLERYVKVLHFFNVVYVWLMLLGILNAVFQNRAFLIDLFQQAGLWGGLRILAASSYLALIYGIVLMLSFLILMTAEALLRLVPATLRYWMAISEDTSPPTT